MSDISCSKVQTLDRGKIVRAVRGVPYRNGCSRYALKIYLHLPLKPGSATVSILSSLTSRKHGRYF